MPTPEEQQVEGLWNQFSGRVKEAWGALSDDDLSRYEGKMDQLVGHIQEKTGEKRTEIRERLDALWDSNA